MKIRLCVLTEIELYISSQLEENFDIVFRKNAGNAKLGTTEESLIELLEKTQPEIAIIEAQPFTERVIKKGQSLKLIASVRTTPSNVDMKAANEAEILVTNAPGRNAVAVAEFTIALLLNSARYIPQAYYLLKTGNYLLPPGKSADNNPDDVIWSNPLLERRPYIDFRGHELAGATLGIFGFGIIGRMVAERAKALGMKVIMHDPYVSEESAEKAGCTKMNLEEMLSLSDYVSLHAKTTVETREIFNLRTFGMMKNTAFLINTARGALIRQKDLIEALRTGLIAGAAIDVYQSEPLQVGDELLTLNNLIHTPHIGGATVDVIRHQSELVMKNLDAYRRGENLPNLWGKN